MKKWFPTLVALLIAISFTACGQNQNDNKDPSSRTEQVSEESVALSGGAKDAGIKSSSTESRTVTGDYSMESTDMIDDFFLLYANRKKSLIWDDVSTALTKAGYTYIVDEGTFSVYDPDNPGYHLGGVPTSEGGIAVVTIGYYADNRSRGAEVEFRDSGDTYYINVIFEGREQVDSLAVLQKYLFNGSR